VNPSLTNIADRVEPSPGSLLVLTGRRVDTEVITRTLGLSGIGGIECRDLGDLCGRIDGGGNAAIIGDEVLLGGDIWFLAETDGPEAVVIVRDNGVGIEREQMDLLFEPFMAISPGADIEEGGLGIGLSIASSSWSSTGAGSRSRAKVPCRGASSL
jgi:hypothetical protein